MVGSRAGRRCPGVGNPPQAAGPGEVILSKRNDLGILSNFAPTPFVYHGIRYASWKGAGR